MLFWVAQTKLAKTTAMWRAWRCCWLAYPVTVGGETVNRLCASGMAATVQAAHALQTGNGDVYISGGVEHMTRGPWVISKASTPFGRDAEMHDTSFGWRFINPMMKELYGTDAMGVTAENLVELYGIEREAQDQFSLWSQTKAAAAQANGRLAEEITGCHDSIAQGRCNSVCSR
jgi:acetyl-CoA acyltransferase